MVHLNFPKVSKLTKINCPELSKAASNFHRFRKRKREKEREREKKKDRVKSLQGILFILNSLYPKCCSENGLAWNNIERDLSGQADCCARTLWWHDSFILFAIFFWKKTKTFFVQILFGMNRESYDKKHVRRGSYMRFTVGGWVQIGKRLTNIFICG